MGDLLPLVQAQAQFPAGVAPAGSRRSALADPVPLTGCSASAALARERRRIAREEAASAAHAPRRAVLFYATDDEVAAAAAERLIGAAGFEPVRAGGVADAARLEVPGGDLHQNGGLNGRLLDADEARAAVAAPAEAD